MSVLASMDENGFAAYLVVAIPAYARDKVASGQWDPETSLERARQAFDDLLPNGLGTPDHHLFTIRAAGTTVGILWFAVQRRAAGDVAYVYDVLVDARHRRQGHALAAFDALEDEVRARGLSGIALHVFGHNVAARALYARLAYEPTNLNLFKKVERRPRRSDASGTDTSSQANAERGGPGIAISPLSATAPTVEQLAGLLVETVAHGGSVGFMHPLDRDVARRFWSTSLAAADRGERVVLGAWDGQTLAGTVTLLLDLPPNQPHRAEIAKMMTRVSHRGRGIATALLHEAEAIARQRHRTLLVLDTAAEEGAAGLYERVGYRLSGVVPDFALKPHGGLTGTMIYWKRLPPAA